MGSDPVPAESQNVVVVLTVGKSDNGKHATLAFSCGLASLAVGHNAVVFLTGDGSVWGYKGSAGGIRTQGFSPLDELISDYLAEGGRLIQCSVCHRTCSVGSPNDAQSIEQFPQVESGGFATIIDLAINGTCITF